MSTDLMKMIYRRYGEVDPVTLAVLATPGGFWVMDRSWYDRIRAELSNPQQEHERAAAHACVYIATLDQPPFMCPACRMGPFATMGELGQHVAAMADPANREPGADYLLGLPIVVREGAGEPHLERQESSSTQSSPAPHASTR